MSRHTRRGFLLQSLAGALATQLPGWCLAAGPGDSRLVVILLRGGLDGLAAVPPIGDTAYESLHGATAVPRSAAIRLDTSFGLHPQLEYCAERWRSGELLPCHAVATPYRDRSHFDGQNVLENGGNSPSSTASGWLNRVIGELPAPAQGLALGQNLPLILRGPAPVVSWAPSLLEDPDTELIERLADLYSGDERLSARLAEATRAQGLSAGTDAGSRASALRRNGADRLAGTAATAGRMLAAADGPRIAVMDANGWDTHSNQGNANGQLANRLKSLDSALRSLQAGLGEAWPRTVVVVLTEFGRTAAVNGTRGTDHGTGTVALLVGGAVLGGRVHADWPGLGSGDLYEGRDLRPTTSVHALLKGMLRDHLGLADDALSRVFPASPRESPVRGLVRG